MNRTETLQLVASLIEHGRWGELSPARRATIEDTWAETLAPYDADDVAHVVKFATEAGRLGLLTPRWVADQCEHIARRRFVEELAPHVECEDCTRLGGGRICDWHRETGRRNIRALRERYGFRPPCDDGDVALAH